ncbi:tetratricopeptide repeat protein [Litorivita pollutaquae]|uniref:tetratricopeptide repeat protein n=1 Tax=Litorivita pollutaquae TaxID=2200892 RepID=UPI0019552699|nr:tetratricopeptide repeat protein [Litorivita pollutaquae]
MTRFYGSAVALVFSAVIVLGVPVPVSAQQADAATLADIRQELTVLHVEMQKLKRELSTTGTASGAVVGGGVLQRVDAIEAEVQRLTGKTEELEFRINSVVKDGTNRIGDLEFRLVELEGGDVSKLGETTTLGGPLPEAPIVDDGGSGDVTVDEGAQMAVGEVADFERAEAALAEGDYATAAELFSVFGETYSGGPLGLKAQVLLGEAREGMDDLTGAARAYLAAFSAAPDGVEAPDALFRLGRTLGRLGQTEEACVTLSEVGVRFPGAPSVLEAQSVMRNLGCL